MKKILPSPAKACITICILVAILYFVGIIDLPYGYYTFLRILSLVALSIFIYQYWVLTGEPFSIINIIIGFIIILFNPFVPVYLDKYIWKNLDFVCGCILIIIALYIICKYTYRNNKDVRKRTVENTCEK